MKPKRPKRRSAAVLSRIAEIEKKGHSRVGKLDMSIALNSYQRIKDYIGALEHLVQVFWSEVDNAGVGHGDASYQGLDKKRIDRAFADLLKLENKRYR